MLASLLLTAPGCYYTTHLTAEPTAMVLSSAPAPAPIPLVIDSVTGTVNGTPSNEAASIEKSYADGLRRFGFFVLVVGYVVEVYFGVVYMMITNTIKINTHNGSAFAKVFFIGLSLFMLTPALPLTIDISQSVNATLTLPSGGVRRYEAASSGRGKWTLFSNPIPITTQLNTKINTATLQELIARIREDGVGRTAQ